MRFGKLYDYINAKDAERLIGKKVIASNTYYDVVEGNCECVGILKKINIEEKQCPFQIEGIIFNNGFLCQFIREIEEDGEGK